MPEPVFACPGCLVQVDVDGEVVVRDGQLVDVSPDADYSAVECRECRAGTDRRAGLSFAGAMSGVVPLRGRGPGSARAIVPKPEVSGHDGRGSAGTSRLRLGVSEFLGKRGKVKSEEPHSSTPKKTAGRTGGVSHDDGENAGSRPGRRSWRPSGPRR